MFLRARSSLALALCLFGSTLVATHSFHAAQPALACSGRVDFEIGATQGNVIVLADAIEVGDATNRAPTPGPSSPPQSRPVPTRSPWQFDLAGVGATLRIVRVYSGNVDPSQPLPVDKGQRAGIERELREHEAGIGVTGTCGIGEFTSRFETGVRYLVFANDTGSASGPYVIARLPVDGDDVVLVDPLAAFRSSPLAYIGKALYHRFFEGIAADVDETREFAHITAERVPLTVVLRAAAFLRGDPSIVPPNTGSAGLLTTTND